MQLFIITETTPSGPNNPPRFRNRLIDAPDVNTAAQLARDNPAGDGFFFFTADQEPVSFQNDRRLAAGFIGGPNRPNDIGLDLIDSLPPAQVVVSDPMNLGGSGGPAPGTSTAPTLTPTPTAPPQFVTPTLEDDPANFLRGVGLAFLAEQQPGEDIRPSFIREQADINPVLGQLSSLFRTPTLNTLRATPVEGIQTLQGAAANVGILPGELIRQIRAVTPGGSQGGSVLA